MAFDQTTRNYLNNFVGQARALLTKEFARQMQSDYGIDPGSGRVDDVAGIVHLDDRQQETARILRDTLHHYTAGESDKKTRIAAIERIVREQAFTILNRLAALRMAEARGLLVPSIAESVRSDGFQLYQQLAGVALGETDETYVAYLFSLFDEFAIDLPVLFDRFSPQGRLFPSVRVLRQLLALINGEEIAPLWAEDETIGWIYQYFNSSEERRQLRKASSAPRNSRELAVRNQFFTPRYVVEFLTDNTLGRIWYEMTKGETRLVDTCRYMVRRPNEVFLAPGEAAPEQEPADDLTQEELLNRMVYIPHRSLKDPREIKMLDPACGSMHFGLYAFDLFETIYEEAWEMGVLGEWAAEYRDKAYYMRDVPLLIIEYNIHGIDIDARAVQIAGLSLWLRAQRSWQAQGVWAADRPTVARSNVVVAEPMPGDEEELEAFLATQFGGTAQDRIVAGLVRRVFEAMKLAGEAGSLLKIEEEIADDIATAKEKWTAQPKLRQSSLFERPQQQSLPMEIPDVSEEQFWEQIEKHIYTALQQFSEQAAQGEGYRRRLFAEDAARGFAFIDLCRQDYDAVLMNPPFGSSSKAASQYIKSRFPDVYYDVYGCFMARAYKLTSEHDGLYGAITDRMWTVLPRLTAIRDKYVANRLRVLADLWYDVLDDAMNRTTAFVVGQELKNTPIVFCGLRHSEDKNADLLSCINAMHQNATYRLLYLRFWEQFEVLPLHRLAYWTPPEMLRLFSSLDPLEPHNAIVKVGLQTSNDFRFLRLWHEVPVERLGSDWSRMAKGGEFAAYVGDQPLVVNWTSEGYELSSYISYTLERTPSRHIQNQAYYFKPGITYANVSTVFNAQILPADFIFSIKGQGIFSTNEATDYYSLLAILNSSVFAYLLDLVTGGHSWDTKAIASLPFPENLSSKISILVQKIMLLLTNTVSRDETSTRFNLVTMRQGKEMSHQSVEALKNHIDELQQQLDKSVKTAYKIEGDAANQIDSYCIEKGIRPLSRLFGDISPIETGSGEQIGIMVGAIIGRWDIRYATGEKASPHLPDPFEPLPVCAPGMLQNADGLPAAPADVPADYPLRISWPGILVDDDGHREDIVDRVREALYVIWGEKADDIESQACALLGVNSLRDYFGNPNRFFDDHLSRYSKSRRAAPIYWPLTTTNGSYTLWLYYHRLDASTLYQCVNDFVDPKLAAMQRQLTSLRNRRRDRDEERELERLTDLTVELVTFRKDLLELARFWWPNLNDGVEITAAPLYALFGNRKWRKRLEGTWSKLQEGEYDWAHLAMSIWPGRIVAKCRGDRSLTIAHDIEKLFWVEDEETWRPLRSPTEEEAQQVEKRQSEERDRLRELFAELAADEGGYLPAMQVWQSLDEGEWDHRPLGLHLYPERAAVAAFDDASRVFPHLDQRGQKLLQKDTQKNKQLLTKCLVERGTPELVAAVEATLADELVAFSTLWQALESGERDDLPLALALWPERVIGKTLRDSDLAAQHGLFDFFWYNEPGVGVRRRKPINREIAYEVERRGGDRL